MCCLLPMNYDSDSVNVSVARGNSLYRPFAKDAAILWKSAHNRPRPHCLNCRERLHSDMRAPILGKQSFSGTTANRDVAVTY